MKGNRGIEEIGRCSRQCHPSEVSLEGRKVDQYSQQYAARSKVRADLGIVSLAQIINRLELNYYGIFDDQIETVSTDDFIPVSNCEFFFSFRFQISAPQLDFQGILIY